METVMKVLIGLCSVLLALLGFLITFFLKYTPPPRSQSQSRGPSTTAGSSSRSRMAARWAHMEQGSRRSRVDPYAETIEYPHEEDIGPDEHQKEDLDDFGQMTRFRSLNPLRCQDGSIASSLVGTGPNGTRTLLKGWFGLDEPCSAGYNTRPEQREKSTNGDVLPMRVTLSQSEDGDHRPHTPVVHHHRVPTTEDEDWETRSQASAV